MTYSKFPQPLVTQIFRLKQVCSFTHNFCSNKLCFTSSSTYSVFVNNNMSFLCSFTMYGHTVPSVSPATLIHSLFYLISRRIFALVSRSVCTISTFFPLDHLHYYLQPSQSHGFSHCSHPSIYFNTQIPGSTTWKQ